MLIREAARRIDGHRWVERRLFEVVGRQAAAHDDPDVARVLAAQAQHHAWRASMWAGVLPVLHDVDPAGEPEPELRSMADDAAELAPLVSSVLPALVRRYETHLAEVEPVADAPVARVLRLVLADLVADRTAAERVLAGRE